VDKAKPFCIAKREVWEAYKRVKANRGAAGVDDQSIEEFDGDLENNLYRLWNRMASGSYMPLPVRRVDISKGEGKTRPLGIPAVSDRIAQAVAKRYLEAILEPLFHGDSYGYRPGRSAHQALTVARRRCWRYDWVLDLDIKGFYDNIDHDLMMRAVRHHTQSPWVLLYIERWLKAPVCMPDGTLIRPEKGTPQGSVVSPVLANLFLHWAFDRWMAEHHSDIPFERYADDAICHCRSEEQALALRDALETRLAACKLELHPQKTKIVYCKDDNRVGNYPLQQFDFLGFTFRARRIKNRDGQMFIGFVPAVSGAAAKAMRLTVRRWRLHHRNDLTLEELATWLRPIITGWMNYYGHFQRSALIPVFRPLDVFLLRWARRKYRLFRSARMQPHRWLNRVRARQPPLFPHWVLEGRLNNGSRMNGDVHVRF
jgi:RNA-directed DNA polymerase